MKSMEQLNVTAIILQESETYVSKCPELEVASAGVTTEEALHNLKEAVELYLENAKALGIFDDSTAIEFMATKYDEEILEPELKPEYVKKATKINKQKPADMGNVENLKERLGL